MKCKYLFFLLRWWRWKKHISVNTLKRIEGKNMTSFFMHFNYFKRVFFLFSPVILAVSANFSREFISNYGKYSFVYLHKVWIPVFIYRIFILILNPVTSMLLTQDTCVNISDAMHDPHSDSQLSLVFFFDCDRMSDVNFESTHQSPYLEKKRR